MKRTLSLIAVTAITALTLNLCIAAEEKEVTISGEGKCAKCALKETKECQNAIQVTKDGKTETYYLVKNDVSDKFHKNVCTATAKVKATGTSKKVDGKNQFTATKIDLEK
jgi:hypothetical protein